MGEGQGNIKLKKTRRKFRPYGTAATLLRAGVGASIKTTVYVNDNSIDNSLLGKKDALMLGLWKHSFH